LDNSVSSSVQSLSVIFQNGFPLPFSSPCDSIESWDRLIQYNTAAERKCQTIPWCKIPPNIS
jgi:hypothetical protein